MASSAILAVQTGRWEGLRTSIELFEASMKADTDPTTRHATGQLMLQALRLFTEEMFTFFQEGFAEGQGAGSFKLVPGNLTRDYVFALLGDQVSYDVDAILRGYMQRRLVQRPTGPQADADQPGVNARSEVIRQKGGNLDLLAYSILMAAMETGVVTRPATVYTYFQKSMRIRLLPYVRVALIGVPYSALSNTYDWLAVAHEVGHYVYRSSVLDDEEENKLQQLRNLTQQEKRWFAPWLEEIAADVFGCIVAGPRIAWSFQELSLQAPKKRMSASDGEHPAPALRPYIYIDTLCKLAARWAGVNLVDVIDRLETAWKGRLGDLAEVHLPTTAATPGGATTEVVPIGEARERIEEQVIAPLLDGFTALVNRLNPASGGEDYLFQALWGRADSWNGVTHESAGVLLPDESALPGLFGGAEMHPELVENDDHSISVSTPLDSALPPEKLAPGQTGSWYDDLRQQLRGETEVVEERWTELLTFGGWIDVGPPGPIPHG